ncbi:hypothetical protein ACVRY7_07030, partial [Streptococcus ictaluri]
LVELPSHSWQSQLPDTHDMEINCLKKKALYKCCTEKCCLFTILDIISNVRRLCCLLSLYHIQEKQ